MQVVQSTLVTRKNRQVVTHTFAKKVSKFGTLGLSGHTVVISISLVHERAAYISSIEETSIMQVHCKVWLTLSSQEILPYQITQCHVNLAVKRTKSLDRTCYNIEVTSLDEHLTGFLNVLMVVGLSWFQFLWEVSARWIQSAEKHTVRQCHCRMSEPMLVCSCGRLCACVRASIMR